MNEEVMQQLTASAEKLASAAEVLDRLLQRLDQQHEALSAKVDRIVAAIDERATQDGNEETAEILKQRLAELERNNNELKAQAARLSRKTLPPLVTTLLAKGVAETDNIDAATLDKALSSLSIEQRIAVKAEMARAGLI